MLKHGILGLLNYGEMTGYEIKEVFEHSLNYFWSAQTSQIYRELQTLAKNHWAECTPVCQKGKPDKKVYHITEAGKGELLRWLAYEESGPLMRTPLLMKVFFLGERSIEENLAFFQGFRQMIAEYIKYMDKAEEPMKVYADAVEEKTKTLYWEMTLDFGKRSMQMHLDWADSCIEKLSALQKRR